MEVNRYTELTPSQFNPLSVEEIMMVPLAKQKKHDEALDFLAQVGGVDAQVHEVDRPGVNAKLDEFKQRSMQLEDTIMNQGIGNTGTIAKEIVKLKRDTVNAFSSSGEIGRSINLYKIYEENRKKILENNKMNPQHQQALLNKLNQDYAATEGIFKNPNATWNSHYGWESINEQDKAIELGEKINDQVYKNMSPITDSKGNVVGYSYQGYEYRRGADGHMYWIKDGYSSRTLPISLLLNKIVPALSNDPDIQSQVQNLVSVGILKDEKDIERYIGNAAMNAANLLEKQEFTYDQQMRNPIQGDSGSDPDNRYSPNSWDTITEGLPKGTVSNLMEPIPEEVQYTPGNKNTEGNKNNLGAMGMSYLSSDGNKSESPQNIERKINNLKAKSNLSDGDKQELKELQAKKTKLETKEKEGIAKARTEDKQNIEKWFTEKPDIYQDIFKILGEEYYGDEFDMYNREHLSTVKQFVDESIVKNGMSNLNNVLQSPVETRALTESLEKNYGSVDKYMKKRALTAEFLLPDGTYAKDMNELMKKTNIHVDDATKLPTMDFLGVLNFDNNIPLIVGGNNKNKVNNFVEPYVLNLKDEDGKNVMVYMSRPKGDTTISIEGKERLKQGRSNLVKMKMIPKTPIKTDIYINNGKGKEPTSIGKKETRYLMPEDAIQRVYSQIAAFVRNEEDKEAGFMDEETFIRSFEGSPFYSEGDTAVNILGKLNQNIEKVVDDKIEVMEAEGKKVDKVEMMTDLNDVLNIFRNTMNAPKAGYYEILDLNDDYLPSLMLTEEDFRKNIVQGLSKTE